MRDVRLFCRDANNITERFAGDADTLIYLDPPYHSADVSGYRAEFDGMSDLAALLAGARARCAISGYGTEWDRLGWHRSEHRSRSTINQTNTDLTPRVEVLWTNYDPHVARQTSLADMM